MITDVEQGLADVRGSAPGSAPGDPSASKSLPCLTFTTIRRLSRRCCHGWSRSAATAGCPGGSSSSCGSDVPASAWSLRPTSSAEWSRPPLPLPPLLPLCHLVSSGRKRTMMTASSGPTNGCSTCAPDVRCSHRCWSRVCSTGHLQTENNNVTG